VMALSRVEANFRWFAIRRPIKNAKIWHDAKMSEKTGTRQHAGERRPRPQALTPRSSPSTPPRCRRYPVEKYQASRRA
jgi:hypothetical protein